MKSYRTGEFSKLANVTERTIRYYDKIGLLKPTFVMENGYRQYTEKDLFKLQKILSLKQLGFSIEEIFPIVSNDENMKDSLIMQRNLLDSRINHLEAVKDTMNQVIRSLDSGKVDWSLVSSLIKLSNGENSIIEHYKNATNLKIRIKLHDKYSTNSQGWFPWVLEQIDFSKVSRLLEVGCGNGKLWESNTIDFRNREIFLTDSSKGMVNEVRKKLGNDFNCLEVNCQSIPFKDHYFDAVIANHVLFYVNDLNEGLSEISRVLKSNGILYCTTYGQKHMKEIGDIVHDFDSRIKLSDTHLYDQFGLENGKEILSEYFKDIDCIQYEDSLEVNHVQPLVDYIMSCHGNQNEIIGPRIEEFKEYIGSLLEKNGKIHISKQAGLFRCRK